MDCSVGAYEAKTHLSALLDRVERGESLTITRNGRPVARLVPAREADRPDAAAVVGRIFALRQCLHAEGVRVTQDEIREWIDAGRR